MAGRKPTPNALKKLKGTNQPARMRDEPDFGTIVKVPPAPKYFNKYAKREYKAVTARLQTLNLLNDVNIALIAAYALEIGKYYEAEEKLSEVGRLDIAKDADGNILKISRLPLDKMASDYLANAKMLAVELGITPSSSSRVKAPEKKQSNPLADFL
ncbi:MAG: phage terminase small subunit P27 family [Marinilabiliaceae bacterium]|nr:phage terminase small subunit P27 family [Marinilabiliaceae bacterium]